MRTARWEKDGLKKGEWSSEEDEKLIVYINRYRIWNWSKMPQYAGLSRSGKSCRLRWMNYLRPDLKRGSITEEEKSIIISMHQKLGNRWSAIAAKIPGRTDNEIKNYWHTHLKKHIKSQESVVPRRSKQLKIKIPDTEADIKNSHESSIKPEASSSPSDQNFSSLTTASTGESDKIYQTDEETCINSWESFEDLQQFWTLPALDECTQYDFTVPGNNLIYESLPPPENEGHGNLSAESHSSFLQEPTSPYRSDNFEYWLDLLHQADMDQMQQQPY